MLTDTLILFRQELLIVLLLLLLLVCKPGRNRRPDRLLATINILLLLNLLTGFFFVDAEGVLFNGMYRSNELVVLQKSMLNLAIWLLSMQAHSWLKNHPHAIEWYILLLTTLLGMFLMLSSGNLLSLYVGLEMATIPLAAAVNFSRTDKRSSEGALKLIISSAFSSALLLLGISFLYGLTGTLYFSEIAVRLQNTSVSVFVCILVFAALAFKISAVPFHLWTADVYEGAPVPVTAYLSAVSKAAAVFVLISVLYTVFGALEAVWHSILVVVSIATIITGNLFALRQENIKRFLAFSSIAQAGFVLVGITGASQQAIASTVFFVLAYLCSNLAVFGVVTLVSSSHGRERISDYRDFYRNNKVLSWMLVIGMFSLAGVPPTAGFFGKLFLLMAGASRGDYLFISIAALNMVVSLYYYLRIVKAVFMDEQEQPMEKIRIPFWPALSLWLCLAGILIAGITGSVYEYIYSLSFFVR